MNRLTPHEILHLSLIEGVGPAAIASVARGVEQGAITSIYSATREDYLQLGFSLSLAHKIFIGARDSSVLEKECALLDRHHVSWTTIQDAGYPDLLRHIHLPPPVLYWQGALRGNTLGIAIVGSRKANWYGKQAIDYIVPPLVEQGCSIISGGALGADSMAHAATLASGGVTIAVLGAGLLVPYPASNKHLFSQIVETGGAVVSPFPLMMHAHAGTFPARNRIIAGMSSGCVVVQAAARSGALITAQFALDQGRNVFAVPGPIEDPLSAGCHALIKQGALLVEGAQDILDEHSVGTAAHGHVQLEVQAGLRKNSKLFVEKKSSELMQKKIFSPAQKIVLEKLPASELEDLPAPTDDAPRSPGAIVLHSCAVPQALDDLIFQTGLNLAQLHELLFELQLQGQLEQNMVGMWQRVRA